MELPNEINICTRNVFVTCIFLYQIYSITEWVYESAKVWLSKKLSRYCFHVGMTSKYVVWFVKMLQGWMYGHCTSPCTYVLQSYLFHKFCKEGCEAYIIW